MQLGMVGLGRMGGNMTRRLLRGGHEVVVYDRSVEAVGEAVEVGATGASTLCDLVGGLEAPRTVWVMVPAGDATEEAIGELAGLLSPGDTVVDGGNSYFKDDVARAERLAARNLHYIDVGTSGGVWGLERGYCMTIGGPAEIVKRLDPLFETLAPGPGTGGTGHGRDAPDSDDASSTDAAGTTDASGSNDAPGSNARKGYVHVGPAGAGHFVKMIHNGIEYGMMQAFAEGLEILRESGSDRVDPRHRYDLDLHAIAEVWRHGSVVSSWLLDLLEIALREDRGPVGLFRVRAGLGGGPLDGADRHRGRRARPRAHGFALHAVPVSAGRVLRDAGAFGPAPPVRRSRGAEQKRGTAMIQIAPSILSADFTRLADEVRAVERAGADRIHIDVMDGRFVPNISMGPFIVEAIDSLTDLPLEAHLMIEEPDRYVDVFMDAGADVIIVHQENTTHLHRVVQSVREQGKQAGVALNPATPAHVLDGIIDDLDLVLVMSVNPGFSGQRFIESVLPKIREIRDTITDREIPCDLEVDGGVNADTAPAVIAAGVNVLVAATAVFKHPEGIAEGIRLLRNCA